MEKVSIRDMYSSLFWKITCCLSLAGLLVACEVDTMDGVLCGYSNDSYNDSVSVKKNSVSKWTCSDTARELSANGIPDHDVGIFPNDYNLNTITEQSVSASYTLEPEEASSVTDLGGSRGVVGYVLNGIKIDADTMGSCNDSGTACSLTDNTGNWSIESLGQTSFNFGIDDNNAHVDLDGSYHYHGIPEGFIIKQGSNKSAMTLIGWAADGFPIYARYGHSVADDDRSALKTITSSYKLVSNVSRSRPPISQYPLGTFKQDWEYVKGSGDLDECNGRTGVTPEFPSKIYHYYATDSYPYFQRCVKGVVEVATMTPLPGDVVAPVTHASPIGGTYLSTQLVTLTADDVQATIYYTLDGSIPSTNSNVYASALSVSESTTLKFLAVDQAGNVEAVKTQVYLIKAAQAGFNAGSDITKTVGDAAFIQVATGGSGAGSVTYGSSNSSVAIVNVNTGEITIAASGVATITATKAADANYQEASDSYVLTVTTTAQVDLNAGSDIIKTVGDAAFTQAAIGGSGTGSVTYRSSDTSVATVNASTGEVTLVASGTTTITATKASDANYQEVSDSYVLTVNTASQVGFNAGSDVIKTVGDAAFTQAATGGSGTGSVTYNSSNTSVATVNASTGEVTLVASGTTTITATKAVDANYQEAMDSYVLTVNATAQVGITQAGLADLIALRTEQQYHLNSHLTVSTELEQLAQVRADEIVASGTFTDRDYSGYDYPRSLFPTSEEERGEARVLISGSNATLQDAIVDWRAEGADYDHNQWNSTTERYITACSEETPCNNFAQLIVGRAKEVGCATAVYPQGSANAGNSVVICLFDKTFYTGYRAYTIYSYSDATKIAGVNKHNEFRGNHYPHQKVAYNELLAMDMQDWTDRMAKLGYWGHAGSSNVSPYFIQGENLWLGSGTPDFAGPTNAWYGNEINSFVDGGVRGVTTCKSGEVCGHASQVVWQNTRYIGCANSFFQDPIDTTHKNKFTLGCRYWPAGNYSGQRMFCPPQGDDDPFIVDRPYAPYKAGDLIPFTLELLSKQYDLVPVLQSRSNSSDCSITDGHTAILNVNGGLLSDMTLRAYVLDGGFIKRLEGQYQVNKESHTINELGQLIYVGAIAESYNGATATLTMSMLAELPSGGHLVEIHELVDEFPPNYPDNSRSQLYRMVER